MSGVRKIMFHRQEEVLFRGVSLVERDHFIAEDSALEFGVPFLHFPYLLFCLQSTVTRSSEQWVLLPPFQWRRHAASTAHFCCLPGRADCRPCLSVDSNVAFQPVAIFFSNTET